MSEGRVARRRVALLLEYDGADFAGLQVQPGRRTVQGTVEQALAQLTGETRRVAFAGRTDAGVHATGQVAAVDVTARHVPGRIQRALNHFLPEDVVVRSAAEVGQLFDPRRDAVARVYRYRLTDGRVRPVLGRRRSWYRERALDCRAMAGAAARLPLNVEQDWAAFAGPVGDGYPTVRTVGRCQVRREGPHAVTVTVEADGFLPHQVRRMVGALEWVGAGKMAPEAFGRLVDGPAGSAGPSAPPQGLTLLAVRYPAGAVVWGAEGCAGQPRERCSGLDETVERS